MKPRVVNYSKTPFFSSKTFNCSPVPCTCRVERCFPACTRMEHPGNHGPGWIRACGVCRESCSQRCLSALKTAQKSLQPLFTVFFFL